MRRVRRGTWGVALAAASAASAFAAVSLGWAQGFNRQAQTIEPNAPYDGRWTFARIRYTMTNDGGFRRAIKWAHDYPRGDRHFTKILGELSTLKVRTLQSNVLALDDPELFKYPVAYLCEAGYWAPSDAEVLGLRNYLLKGGFIIFDDFARNDWMNFETQMHRVLPELRPMRLTTDDKVFDAFYRIRSLEYNHPYYGMPSEFWGIFENNDRSKRLMAVINFNNDISEYWEWSDEGLFPMDASNEAYKLGVNYLIYALTR
jgi:hypothetical protein